MASFNELANKYSFRYAFWAFVEYNSKWNWLTTLAENKMNKVMQSKHGRNVFARYLDN